MKCGWIDKDTVKTILSLICLTAIPVVVNSTGIYLIWNWYFPALFGLKNISFIGSIGLSLFFLLAMTRFNGPQNVSDRETNLITYIDNFGIKPIIWLCIGYAFHFFI